MPGGLFVLGSSPLIASFDGRCPEHLGDYELV